MKLCDSGRPSTRRGVEALTRPRKPARKRPTSVKKVTPFSRRTRNASPNAFQCWARSTSTGAPLVYERTNRAVKISPTSGTLAASRTLSHGGSKNERSIGRYSSTTRSFYRIARSQAKRSCAPTTTGYRPATSLHAPESRWSAASCAAIRSRRAWPRCSRGRSPVTRSDRSTKTTACTLSGYTIGAHRHPTRQRCARRRSPSCSASNSTVRRREKRWWWGCCQRRASEQEILLRLPLFARLQPTLADLVVRLFQPRDFRLWRDDLLRRRCPGRHVCRCRGLCYGCSSITMETKPPSLVSALATGSARPLSLTVRQGRRRFEHPSTSAFSGSTPSYSSPCSNSILRFAQPSATRRGSRRCTVSCARTPRSKIFRWRRPRRCSRSLSRSTPRQELSSFEKANRAGQCISSKKAGSRSRSCRIRSLG